MGNQEVIYNSDLKVIGHRGHVSHFPENTIPGFLSAMSLGVDGVEMDLVISADKKVVVSHEPYMSAATVITPAGMRISRSREREYNIYQMSYDSIRKYIVGVTGGRKYGKQERIQTHKPLLQEALKAMEDHRKRNDLLPPIYYLEVKSGPEDYEIFQPSPDEFAELVMKAVQECDMEEAVVIQSFDANFLNVLKQRYPQVQTSFLIYRTPWQEGLKHLEFKPEVISLHYRQLKQKEQVEELQALGFKVIPWTVNRKRRIRRMINFGVDGIITDYPERVLELNQKSLE